MSVERRKWNRANRVREAAREYMELTGMSVPELAELCGASTYALDRFVRAIKSAMVPWPLVESLDAFMKRRPVRTETREAEGDPWNTNSQRQIRDCFCRAADDRQIVLLYGPPGTQKSWALLRAIHERNRAKQPAAVFVYAGPGMTMNELLTVIGREVGVPIRTNRRARLRALLIDALRENPLAIVIDEAQHLSVDCLEIVRELADRTECGLLLSGSHSLYLGFARADRRLHLEQWISRTAVKVQLSGLTEREIRQIAAPFGVNERAMVELVESCRAQDPFCEQTKTYFSARRLSKKLEAIQKHRGGARMAAAS